MAALVLSAAGAPPAARCSGRSAPSPGGSSARSPATSIDSALFGAGSRRARRRAAARRSRRDGLDRGRADPARLWPRADRRPGDLGDQARGGRQTRSRQPAAAARACGGGRHDHDHNDLYLLRQSRGRPVRRADRPRRRASGPTASRSISHGCHHARSSRRRDAGARPLIVAKEGAANAPAYRGPRLCGVRAAAAGEFRQPHSAVLVRGRASGRRAGTDGPRGDADPRHHRVRLRAGDRGAARSGPAQSAPENRHVAHAPSDVEAALDDLQAAVPEPRTRRARGGLVRRRSARRPVHASARRREPRTSRPTAPPGRSPGVDARGRASGLARSTAGRPSAARRPIDERHAPDPRAEGARAEGHALSVRDDGHSGRQRAARSVDRRGAAAGLSVARPHHLRSGAGRPGSPDGSAGGGDAGRRLLRHRRRRPAGTIAAWSCTTPTLRRAPAASTRS